MFTLGWKGKHNSKFCRRTRTKREARVAKQRIAQPETHCLELSRHPHACTHLASSILI